MVPEAKECRKNGVWTDADDEKDDDRHQGQSHSLFRRKCALEYGFGALGCPNDEVGEHAQDEQRDHGSYWAVDPIVNFNQRMVFLPEFSDIDWIGSRVHVVCGIARIQKQLLLELVGKRRWRVQNVWSVGGFDPSVVENCPVAEQERQTDNDADKEDNNRCYSGSVGAARNSAGNGMADQDESFVGHRNCQPCSRAGWSVEEEMGIWIQVAVTELQCK